MDNKTNAIIEEEGTIRLDLAKLIEESQGVYDADDFRDAARIFNAIAWACKHRHEYKEGMRNNIAVDLSISSYVLGLDPYEVMKLFIRDGLIDVEDDDEVTVYRFRRIEPYLDGWCDDGDFRAYYTEAGYWVTLNFNNGQFWTRGDICVVFD